MKFVKIIYIKFSSYLAGNTPRFRYKYQPMFTEIMAVYSGYHINHINTVCGRSAELFFFNFRADGTYTNRCSSNSWCEIWIIGDSYRSPCTQPTAQYTTQIGGYRGTVLWWWKSCDVRNVEMNLNYEQMVKIRIQWLHCS
jgi:hypothetical protein